MQCIVFIMHDASCTMHNSIVMLKKLIFIAALNLFMCLIYVTELIIPKIGCVGVCHDHIQPSHFSICVDILQFYI